MDELREVKDEILFQDIQADIDEWNELTTRLGWLSRRRFEQELDAFNITVPQFMALRCIAENEAGCNMSELAEASNQVSATMTGIVDRLEDRGLVMRERDPRDRRAQRVALTPAGKALMQQIRRHKQAWIGQFLSTLSPEERRLMIQMARRYLEVIEQTVDLA